MHRLIWTIFALALTAGAPAAAQAAPEPAAAAARKAAAVSKFLAPGDLDPALVLPPPPKDGSGRTQDEFAELHRFQALGPERRAQAQHDDEVEDVTAIADVLGSAFDLARLPATARLFADLRHEDSIAAKRAKAFFLRTRPWRADPTLTPCTRSDAVKSAYPSGHATMGYAAGAVLANLMPDKAQSFLARASDYAESRLVCGAHYRSDIEGGHVLATALVDRLMTKPAFVSELEAARKELTAAKLAP